MKFENRVAVVTGGAGRIGRALAENLCEQNVAVALADISAEQAESVAERLRAKGGTVRAYAMDVEHTESVQSAAGQILADFGRRIFWSTTPESGSLPCFPKRRKSNGTG